ncbi:MAG: hypothetical protein U5R31_06790 [Acidimicrobiia bacterium]|nr:hypothetical protein [Acidimicrobiia bacterium]
MTEIVDALDDHQPGAMGVAIGVDLLAGPTEPIHRLILEALAVAARGEETHDVIGPALERMSERIRKRVDEAGAAGLIGAGLSADALVAMFQRMVLGSIVAKAVELPGVDPRESEHLIATFLLALVPTARC